MDVGWVHVHSTFFLGTFGAFMWVVRRKKEQRAALRQLDFQIGQATLKMWDDSDIYVQRYM
jgi:hypothetical protein